MKEQVQTDCRNYNRDLAGIGPEIILKALGEKTYL